MGTLLPLDKGTYHQHNMVVEPMIREKENIALSVHYKITGVVSIV